MRLGDIFSSLIGRVARETAQDMALRGLADHANRRKRGDPPPASVHASPIVLTLTTIATVALCLVFAWLVFDSAILEGKSRAAGLMISGGLAVTALLGLWNTLSRRIAWDETTVRFYAWNGERTAPWTDIVGIEQKTYPSRIRITLRDGKRFTIYETMCGSRYFMRLIEIQLTPQTPIGGKRRRRRQDGKKGAGPA